MSVRKGRKAVWDISFKVKHTHTEGVDTHTPPYTHTTIHTHAHYSRNQVKHGPRNRVKAQSHTDTMCLLSHSKLQ